MLSQVTDKLYRVAKLDAAGFRLLLATAAVGIIGGVLSGYNIGMVPVYTEVFRASEDCASFVSVDACTLSPAYGTCRWVNGGNGGSYCVDRDVAVRCNQFGAEGMCLEHAALCTWLTEDRKCRQVIGWTAEAQGIYGTVHLPGCVLGSAGGGHIVGLGRKRAVMLFGLVAMAGASIMAVGSVVNSFAALLLGRLVSGIAYGGACVVAPLYVSEMAPGAYRGALGAVFEVSLAVGIVVASLLGVVFDTPAPRVAPTSILWQLISINVVLAAVGGAFCVAAVCIPESTVWVAQQRMNSVVGKERQLPTMVEDDVQQAATVAPISGAPAQLTAKTIELSAYHSVPSSAAETNTPNVDDQLPPNTLGEDGMAYGKWAAGSTYDGSSSVSTDEHTLPRGVRSTDALANLDQLQPATTTSQMESSGSMFALLTNPRHRFTLLVATVLNASLQLTGITAVETYAPSILQQAGMRPLIGNFAFNASGAVAAFFSMPVAQRVPFRKLYLIGLAVLTVSCVVAGVGCLDSIPLPSVVHHVLVGTGLVFFRGSFAVATGPSFYVLAIEIFPYQLRENGSAFVQAQSFLVSILLSLLYPIGLRVFSGGARDKANQGTGVAVWFFVFAVVGAVSFEFLRRYLHVDNSPESSAAADPGVTLDHERPVLDEWPQQQGDDITYPRVDVLPSLSTSINL